eukprot:12766952-Ditylum_brightwellii.AAC.1
MAFETNLHFTIAANNQNPPKGIANIATISDIQRQNISKYVKQETICEQSISTAYQQICGHGEGNSTSLVKEEAVGGVMTLMDGYVMDAVITKTKEKRVQRSSGNYHVVRSEELFV